MGLTAALSAMGIRARANNSDREPLIPRDGPGTVDRFYGEIGRLQEQARDSTTNWVWSWFSDYRRIPSGKTDAEYQADGRRAMNAAVTKAVGKAPGGPIAIAADTEGQALLLWLASSGTSDRNLKTVLENVALLKEGRAAGQAAGAATSLVPVIGQLPLVDKAGKLVGNQAIKFATKKLSEAIAASDRDALAEHLHAAAVAELSAPEWRDKPPPGIANHDDPRHALYALAVLRVDMAVLKQDAEHDPPEFEGRRYVRLALN